MINYTKENFCISSDVKAALKRNRPVLAMESTLIAHGMPYPENKEFALTAINIAQELNVVPAIIAILDGTVHIGIQEDQLVRLAMEKNIVKTSVQNISYVLSTKQSGATTVSATARFAHLAGIHVLPTGGIGGVHRGAENTFDISQDITELSKTSIVVVSSGAKAILDIPKTLEALETASIPVIGHRTNDFPAFYSQFSGCPIETRLESAFEIASLFQLHRNFGMSSGILVANPVQKEHEIPKREMDGYVNEALKECNKNNITGKEITPFLLNYIVEITGGRSLKTNVSLALNNVRLGSKIASAISLQQGHV